MAKEASVGLANGVAVAVARIAGAAVPLVLRALGQDPAQSRKAQRPTSNENHVSEAAG